MLEGEDRTFFFDITFLDGFSNDLNFIWVSAVNADGSTMPWTETGRQFKVWDCEVPVSGSVYDGSSQEAECEANFTDKVGAGFYDSLDFHKLGTSTDYSMTIDSLTSDYLSGENSLDWGFNYNPVFGNLNGEDVVLKVTDVGGTVHCDNEVLLETAEVIDPYSTLPRATVDFSVIVNSDPWFQVENGGVQVGGDFSNLIPVTCVNNENCQSVTAIGGLVSAGGSMNKGCENCSFANPEAWLNSDLVTGSLAYQYFYNEYFVKLGQGSTLLDNSTMSDVIGIGTTGIYFVEGNFWVNQDNFLTTATDDYLIIIASGSIFFDDEVNLSTSSGIFIADGDIVVVDGVSEDVLTIEGMLFSTNGNIELGRERSLRSLNNSSPGVVVKYRPDYLFKLPGEITSVLSGWREK
jgi:hypothetical protein